MPDDHPDISASNLARAITFSEEVVQASVDGTPIPTQMTPSADSDETLVIMAQAILLLFREVNGGR